MKRSRNEVNAMLRAWSEAGDDTTVAQLRARAAEIMAERPYKIEDSMPIVAGRRFRCDCSGNVFSRMSDETFVCNSCGTVYAGEPYPEQKEELS